MQALDLIDPFQDRSHPFNDHVLQLKPLNGPTSQLEVEINRDPLLLMVRNHNLDLSTELDDSYVRPFCDIAVVRSDAVVMVHDDKWVYALSEVGS